MTDRLKALTVTLRPDLRDDDAQPIINAIRLIKGVIDVTPHVADMDHYIAVETARQELVKKVWDALKPQL